LGDSTGRDRHRSEDAVLDDLHVDGQPAGEASKDRLSDGGTIVDLEVSGPVSAGDVDAPDEFDEAATSNGIRFVGPDPREEGRFCTIGIESLETLPPTVRIVVDCSWSANPYRD
jgi:hypothetical protein